MNISRRHFLGASASAVIAAGTMAQGKVFGANERIRVGIIGLNGRGGSHINGFTHQDDCDVVAICDVDEQVLARRATEIANLTGKRPTVYTDMRDLLASDDIDAVSIATPNHWHSLATIWACEAGKDVYVEKPLSHNVWEGRQLVNAAKKYNRIVQHGSQRRSEISYLQMIKQLRSGIIGDLYLARGLCYKWRDSIGFGEPMAPPEDLHWDLWQGPALRRPYIDYPNKQGGRGIYVHYNWHWFWAFGNGDIGNQGVHQVDVALWGLDKGMPVRVSSTGGRYTYEDQAETPNTLLTAFTYADGSMLEFEVRGRATNSDADTRIGNLFYGSGGCFVEGDATGDPDKKFQFYDNSGKRIPQEEISLDDVPQATGDHYRTFLNAVKSRKEEELGCTALQGHISSAHCHLANIAYRLGTSLEFDPETEKFTGPMAGEANAMLKPEYAEGFEVPDLS